MGVDESGQDEGLGSHEGATLPPGVRHQAFATKEVEFVHSTLAKYWSRIRVAVTTIGGMALADVSRPVSDTEGDYGCGMAWATVRQHIPNALTILRFAAIPVFVVLLVHAGDGAAWGAGLFFAGAALTDQVDGYLARSWNVESAFGKVADPLADRAMIVTAVVALWATGRIPLLATLIILGRDLLLVLGYKFLVPRGYAFEVSFLGKAATWVLYASLCVVIVTAEGTLWPLVLLWFGIVLALIAGIQYLVRARRELAPGEPGRETHAHTE